MTHMNVKEDRIDKQDNERAIHRSEETKACKSENGSFSFKRFINYIDLADQNGVIPRVSLDDKTNILTWIPTSPVLVRHELPGEDLGDALSQDISKLWLSQPHLNNFTEDENEDDIALGLFSIVNPLRPTLHCHQSREGGLPPPEQGWVGKGHLYLGCG